MRQAIGRFKGGLTTKILALTDALGNLVRIVLLPGQRFDTVGVPPLIDGVTFGALIGDTAFDSNDIVADLNERGAKVVIAQHPRRTRPLAIDTALEPQAGAGVREIRAADPPLPDRAGAEALVEAPDASSARSRCPVNTSQGSGSGTA